jgi:hypothetical protein
VTKFGRRRREIKTAAQIHEIVARVADLAGVVNPNDKELINPNKPGVGWCESFCENVESIIRPPEIDPQKRNALLRAELAFRAAREAILALDKRDQVVLRRAFLYNSSGSLAPYWLPPPLQDFAGKRIWNRALDELLWTFSEFTGSNPFPAPPNGRGRPRGTVGNWQLQKFVEILWETTKLYGGNLYADPKRDDGGTMIQALELLRPVLPESFLPKVLPVRTIETIIKNFKASGRSWG